MASPPARLSDVRRVSHDVRNCGARVPWSKKSARWALRLEHEWADATVALRYSLMSGRAVVLVNGVEVYNARQPGRDWAFGFALGSHTATLTTAPLELSVDGRRFHELDEVDMGAHGGGASADAAGTQPPWDRMPARQQLARPPPSDLLAPLGAAARRTPVPCYVACPVPARTPRLDATDVRAASARAAPLSLCAECDVGDTCATHTVCARVGTLAAAAGTHTSPRRTWTPSFAVSAREAAVRGRLVTSARGRVGQCEQEGRM